MRCRQSSWFVCLQSLGTKGTVHPLPTLQNKGTCSTSLETGCKPVLFYIKSKSHFLLNLFGRVCNCKTWSNFVPNNPKSTFNREPIVFWPRHLILTNFIARLLVVTRRISRAFTFRQTVKYTAKDGLKFLCAHQKERTLGSTMLESFAAKMPLKLKIKSLWTSLNPSEVFLLQRSEAIIKT